MRINQPTVNHIVSSVNSIKEIEKLLTFNPPGASSAVLCHLTD